MNRAARRVAASTVQRSNRPAFGRPIDYLRQLAAMGVVAEIRRGGGRLRVDWIVAADRASELRAVRTAFSSAYDWDTVLLATLTAIMGDAVDEIPQGSSVSVSLAKVLADPVDGALTRQLLARGARQ